MSTNIEKFPRIKFACMHGLMFVIQNTWNEKKNGKLPLLKNRKCTKRTWNEKKIISISILVYKTDKDYIDVWQCMRACMCLPQIWMI